MKKTNKKKPVALKWATLKAPRNLVVWKKARIKKFGLIESVLVKLKIAKDTPTRFRTGREQVKDRKCRAAAATVVSFHCAKTGKRLRDTLKVFSQHDNNFIYKIGKTIKPQYRHFDTSHEICSTGIHFFVEKDDAKAYRFN